MENITSTKNSENKERQEINNDMGNQSVVSLEGIESNICRKVNVIKATIKLYLF